MLTTQAAITDEFVNALAERATEAEKLRRLPDDTVTDLIASGFTDLLVPARFGGQQAPFPAILDPVRRLAHGCTSSAWTIGFLTLHNWMLALFGEQAQQEAFDSRPFLAPAPLAPTGRGLPVDGGIRLTGRWSWATGVIHGNWIIVAALCGPDDGIYPALALLPIGDVTVEDVWHTDGMRATGSNDAVATDVFVPEHRLVKVTDIYAGTAPGAGLHDSATYRWPMVPALALLAAMPALGSAERVTEMYAQRLAERVLPYEGVMQKDKPIAQAHLAGAQVRLRSLRGLLADTVGEIEGIVDSGDSVDKPVRAQARLAAAHIVAESRAMIGDLMGAGGASIHFLSSPMQRFKRDVDVLAGHVVFDYDTSRELAGALALGMKIPRTSMI
ncbi:acyl-CoA dehydrogenase [Mycobacterium sp. CBMA293]|uniref:acyl-CoA dehydrogenase family protein n=1 Tax=unclassified Mycolicibacterium TaxID=2636767 RepID=UPI0012DD5A87|nr:MULTISPECIES: acyl-CoA dehydrogenase family protein [unclassified Mycolicibacterium]MUL46459.1 acyl-CoA dehydrogenase [Mycolicibacterium sp. CBMA 360]MUL57029.1 acyl-CoA dehydrogenase [Mycolicibacterium sp. CBMA 335]MUL70069.1 acyl-CoA dehydrogenase [Mycolicibacterium sp. CBMA 311]MUL92117.1 acyl-CoA dehydrogenase [Mycolicibacterium sp. CBMA 230]MUM05855.1 acyl-CoA dehydrogenase [Mycolicibacterium sp. CBMA 213]